ncbi:MAG: SUMF1/EgtB/PvdO family nonheme iron enzyme, partial [Coprobacter sp.]|nr:SUMF1/EgtB/PvdO family nonheme iron enzyme [Coprobacter sp.]
MKLLNKFYTLLATVALIAFATTSCDKDDEDKLPDVKLTAQLTSQPEGLDSFEEEFAIMTVSAAGTQNNALAFTDANGNDLSNFKMTAVSGDKTWCVATCSSRRLALSIAKNTSENSRQTTVEISVASDGVVLDTYELVIVQNGTSGSSDIPGTTTSVADIKQFLIQGQVSSAINSTIITVVMPAGTDLTNLTPILELSEGATCTPGNLVAQDFTNPVVYTVTSADGTVTKTYTVVVTLEKAGSGSGDNDARAHNPAYVAFDHVSVGAGSFMMGRDESGQFADKTNTHKVNISALKVGKYEVTQREFQQIMGYNPSPINDDDLLPVHKVTLFEAMLYCNKLSERDGLTPVYTLSNEYYVTVKDHQELYEATVKRNKTANGWRLPTNAEYEYIAKGGPNKDKYYYSGSNDINEVCWMWDNSLIAGVATLRCVGTKNPNSLGIYDMSGNIEEYTTEWYLSIDYLSDAEETDPWGPDEPRS